MSSLLSDLFRKISLLWPINLVVQCGAGYTRALNVKLPLEDLPQLFQVRLKQSCVWDLLVSPLSLPLALQDALDLSLSFSFLGGEKKTFSDVMKDTEISASNFLKFKS